MVKLTQFIENDRKVSSVVLKNGVITEIKKRILEPHVLANLVRAFHVTVQQSEVEFQRFFENVVYEYLDENINDMSINDLVMAANYAFTTYSEEKINPQIVEFINLALSNITNLNESGLMHLLHIVLKVEYNETFLRETKNIITKTDIEYEQIMSDIERQMFYSFKQPSVDLNIFPVMFSMACSTRITPAGVASYLTNYFLSIHKSLNRQDLVMIFSGVCNYKLEGYYGHILTSVFLEYYRNDRKRLSLEQRIVYFSSFVIMQKTNDFVIPGDV